MSESGNRFEWPVTLPLPQISGYALDDAFDVVRPDASLGFASDWRQGQVNAPQYVDFALTLDEEEFAVFDWVVERRTRTGAAWMYIPLKLGAELSVRRCRFASVQKPSLNGLHWTVSGRLELYE